MKKKISGFVGYLIAIGLLSAGLGIVYYAFELVSVPHVREYSEGGLIIVGLILAICGAGLGGVTYRKARQHPVDSQTVKPQAV